MQPTESSQILTKRKAALHQNSTLVKNLAMLDKNAYVQISWFIINVLHVTQSAARQHKAPFLSFRFSQHESDGGRGNISLPPESRTDTSLPSLKINNVHFSRTHNLVSLHNDS